MNFQEIEFTKIPAFSHFEKRVHALYPTCKIIKAGKDFDTETYRVYVQNKTRVAVDMPGDLLKDILDDPTGGSSSYSSEIISKLDSCIVNGFKNTI